MSKQRWSVTQPSKEESDVPTKPKDVVICRLSVASHIYGGGVKWDVFFLLLFLVGWGWVSWYCGQYWPIVPAPDDRWWWLWRNWWNIDWQGKPKYSEKTCPSATLSITNPTWLDPSSNPGSRGGKRATNRLTFGAALNEMILVAEKYRGGIAQSVQRTATERAAEWQKFRVPVKTEFYFSPCRPDGFWGPPSLLSSGYWGFFPRGVKLTIHLQPVPRSRMRGSRYPLSHTFSWRNAELVKQRCDFLQRWNND
jgi:hypothetical protein